MDTAVEGGLRSDELPENVEPLAAGDPAAIGSYVLAGKLGSGGMGTVYLAKLPDSGQLAAIKVIRPELAHDEATRARFRDEMQNAQRVASFCTAKVLDFGTFESRPYMVTEYISGTALSDQVAQRGPLDSGTLHGFALGVAAALAAIHGAGLVHRDLKPANVLLSLSGPRVIDFGIARALHGANDHTRAGIVMGSPGWMAPEQLMEEQVTPKADVFAWGCLVAFAGTGKHPFGNGDAMTLGKRVLFTEPDISGLSAPLDRLVARALNKDPNQRPSAQDLLLELVGGGSAPQDPNAVVSEALNHSWRPPPLPPGMGAPPMPPQQQFRPPPPHPGPPPQGPHTGRMPPVPHGPAPQGGPMASGRMPAGPLTSGPVSLGPRPAGPPPGGPVTGDIPRVGYQGATGPAGEMATGARPYVPPVPPRPHTSISQPRRRSGLVIALIIAVIVLLLLAAGAITLSSALTQGNGGGAEAPAPGADAQQPAGTQFTPRYIDCVPSGAVQRPPREPAAPATDWPGGPGMCWVVVDVANDGQDLVSLIAPDQQLTTAGPMRTDGETLLLISEGASSPEVLVQAGDELQVAVAFPLNTIDPLCEVSLRTDGSDEAQRFDVARFNLDDLATPVECQGVDGPQDPVEGQEAGTMRG
ncbi:serine/threonine-protein kinase [Allonocardiopsis opalescens]